MHNINCTRDGHRKYFSISFEYLTSRIALNYGGVTQFHRTTDAPEHGTEGGGRGRMVAVKELMSSLAPISLLLSYTLLGG